MFKVGFEKAYDNVDWSFLDYVLLKKGFGEMTKVDSRLYLHCIILCLY